jgi:hypothetical protein
MTSKKNKLGDGVQIVGAQMPRRANDVLNLLALSKGVSKSDIIRDAINQIIPNEKQIAEIAQSLAGLAIQNYLLYKSSHVVFVNYRRDLEKAFRSKGISSLHLGLIMQEVSKAYAESKKIKRASQRGKEAAQKGRR